MNSPATLSGSFRLMRQVEHQFGYWQTEKELVNSVLHNKGRFAEIINNTKPLVSQIVCRMIPNQSDRKDLAQEIYLKAFRNLQSFNNRSRISTWIATIAYNSCVDHLRKKRPQLNIEQVLENTHTAIDERSNKETTTILQAAIDNLTPVYKTLVTLYHQEELSYEEIAEITNLPIGTVKNYLFRARKTLKNILLVQYKKEDL